MSLVREEDDFFEEASSLIYSWLSEEEKRQLQAELIEEETASIQELRSDLRFFRLLHFIQVKYIKVEEWISAIFHLLEVVNSKSPNVQIEDIVFKDADDKDVSIRKIQGELRIAKPETIFQGFLEQIKLRSEFSRYLTSLKMMGMEW